ncbi:L,D-transpeptidase family protein [Chlorobium sp. N1]|uniref:L,D-transpeptidase family protein n=1 Tax=Chlorobium sp. N1 TaxID=2491138 RepID=UPI00103A4558|nr:L,D-transpeptidase family protein [Chlorobium sp. N1]TCD47887.1 murein L,D-transpeptidase [Chlorobium sp. N1]
MLFLLLVLFAFSPAPPAGEAPRPEDRAAMAIEARLEGLLREHPAPDRMHACIRQLYDLYAPRGFRPIWAGKGAAAALFGEVEASDGDGLNPRDYHRDALAAMTGEDPPTPAERARRELLQSDAFLTLADHLSHGKVDPVRLDPNWNLHEPSGRSVVAAALVRAAGREGPGVVLEGLRPRHPKYRMLRDALARYRGIEEAGGWSAVPPGPALSVGMRSPRVALLRRRLSATGELALSAAADAEVYDRALVEALRRFQRRHGLKPDGVAGGGTLEALNVPVSRRIDELRLNLERYRWFLGGLDSTYVLVNIAGYSLQYVEDGRFRWSTRVIVGRPFRRTPVFKSPMTAVVFNPQWVVPPTILRKDALPAIRKDRGWLRAQRLSVVDRDGRTVDPATIDWNSFGKSDFPYSLRQASGDWGALGRLKFVMPNPHLVYLHDTPTRELFEKSERTFSSGCIRVENPRRLAELVLADSVRWNPGRIDSLIASGRTVRVALPRPVPVLILYLTAVAEGERVLFRRDVYRRDGALLKALDSPLPNYKTESCGF